MEPLRYVVLANGLLAVVSLVFYGLLRRETFFDANRLALWLGLLASLVLPLVQLPDWRPQPVKAVMQRTARVIVPRILPSPTALQPDATITFPNGQSHPAFPGGKVQSGWSWQQGLVSLYLVVFFVLLGRFGYRLLSLMRLIRQSAKEPYDDFILVRNTGVTSPFSFFGWVVLNPDHHAPDELDNILRHEREHVRTWHSADMLGAELLCILFWFNPAAYLFRHLVHQTLEFSADRAVLANGIDPRLYQYHLVKVSLTAGQSVITNHFSQSQLRSRIVMLNRQRSSPSTWLRYPVLCIATLFIATAFARPTAWTLKKYVSAPIAETIAVVINPREITKSTIITKPLFIEKNDSKSFVRTDIKPKPLLTSLPDSTNTVRQLDSVLLSPCRYVIYKGEYLCWIITPKTSLDDLTLIRQEMKKHGYTLQIREIRYHEDFDYIYALDYRILNSRGSGGGSSHPPSLNRKPICLPGGLLGIGPKTGQSYGGASVNTKINQKTDKIPAELKRIAIEDSIALAESIRDKRIEPIIKYGSYKLPTLGDSSQIFRREFVKTDFSGSSGITVRSNGYLSVNESLKHVNVFLNEKPIPQEALELWSYKQLYAVIKKLKYDPINKEFRPSALLIYANEDN